MLTTPVALRSTSQVQTGTDGDKRDHAQKDVVIHWHQVIRVDVVYVTAELVCLDQEGSQSRKDYRDTRHQGNAIHAVGRQNQVEILMHGLTF